MLEIKNIVKDYNTGSDTVHALRDVSISFRESELVSVLGQSGCGKTTLLNIIGGLDQYTSGDLIINGKSTKNFRDKDWDTYRNHSVGFIFQSYNLIPHQTVLSNVELALTLSGVSKSERRQRAKEALEKVGLGDQLYKRPNQMSGGQMQRVAIARALVNDPDILLADEPTGALDSETSLQIMELIKEIANDRLVIMVTHNPDLAETYSTRIIKLLDGRIVDDSNPFDGNETKEKKKSAVKKGKKTSMSFATALSLSRNNLLTKKGRTFLTSFAGSIGIIGIALILSLSTGVQAYINSVERSTLVSYPISIQQNTMNSDRMISTLMGARQEEIAGREENRIYTNDISTEFVKSMLSNIQVNNLAAFKEYLESNPDNILDSIRTIKYSYDSELYIFGRDRDSGNIIQMNPSTVMDAMFDDSMAGSLNQLTSTYSSFMAGGGNMYNAWHELLNNEMLESQYEILAGRLPESYDEVVILVTENNELSDVTLYSLGLRDQSELKGMASSIWAGESFDLDTGDMSFSYDELMDLRFSLVIAPQFYQKNSDGTWTDMRGDEEYMEELLKDAPEIKVVGILRPDDDALISMSSNSGGVGYTHDLPEYMIKMVQESEIVKQQQADPETDVFTGMPFKSSEDTEEEEEPKNQREKMQLMLQNMMKDGVITSEQLQKIWFKMLALMPEEQLKELGLPEAMISMITSGSLEALISAGSAGGLSGGAGGLPSGVIGTLPGELPEGFDGFPTGDIPEGFEDYLSGDMTGLPEGYEEYMQDGTGGLPSGVIGTLPGELPLGTDTGADADAAAAAAAAGMSPTDAMGGMGAMAGMPGEEDMSELMQKMSEYVSPMQTMKIFQSVLTYEQYNMFTNPVSTEATYDGNLELLGVADLDHPSSISIYATDFDGKERLTDFITAYNNRMNDEGRQEDVINYTDIVGLMISSISDIINAITYILIAFVAISLIVSSIMIGIITYISVLERTKEIGILRAIGASKRDISNVFNAETLIVGFSAGVIGILVTLVLNIPINIIIEHITGISNVAILPWQGGLILVIISMLLTLIAGLFPAGFAAKKDPVEALRTE